MTPSNPKHRLVLLFAGHMVDLPDRTAPRFPPEMEKLAAEAIEASLRKVIDQSKEPLFAVSSSARGGDILFLEACRRSRIECYIVLPFEPQKFVETSVEGPATGRWADRFWEQWNATPEDHREILSDVIDPDGPYAACNRRIVEIAKLRGNAIHLVTLWNGATGDGPGGTAYLVERVHEAGGSVDWIDSRLLLERISRR